MKKYRGNFSVKIEEKKLNFKRPTVPVALQIKVRDEGIKNIFTYCDRCKEPTPQMRIPGVIQCITCGYTKRL